MTIFFLLYFSLWLISFLCSYFFPSNVNTKLIQVIFSGLLVWLVLALRSPYCGVDLIGSMGSGGYIDGFKYLSQQSLLDIITGEAKYSTYEMGYMIYCNILGKISTNVQFFLAVTSAIGVLLISSIFYKYSSNVFLSYIIYVSFGLYLFSFSGLRQYLALSITFFSVKYLLDSNKKIIYFLLVLLASTFHSSAIIFLVAFFLPKIKLTLPRALFAMVLLIALSLFMRDLVAFFTTLLFENRYHLYSDEGGAVTMFIVYLAIFLTSFLWGDSSNKNLNFFRWMILFATSFQSLGLISAGAMTRIAYYFSIFFPLIFPAVLSCCKDDGVKLLLNVSLVILFIVYFYLTSKGGYLNVIPYHFYWENGYSLIS